MILFNYFIFIPLPRNHFALVSGHKLFHLFTGETRPANAADRTRGDGGGGEARAFRFYTKTLSNSSGARHPSAIKLAANSPCFAHIGGVCMAVKFPLTLPAARWMKMEVSFEARETHTRAPRRAGPRAIIFAARPIKSFKWAISNVGRADCFPTKRRKYHAPIVRTISDRDFSSR